MGFMNIPTKTLGGKVFWYTLKSKNGWKLQQNKFTFHYRILDPENVRRDWGTDLDDINKAFDLFTGSY
ncbi:hypothetical protein [Clostridium aciditolerans]|uniref:Uncharacterized protein n=1 Tax=Clostridium aciditolerans TaxID=339861 RepID=A0A934HVS0_9CLOT|nr:hypothetical protein [Clostridium aciditolerans]MBI6875195.1 hypothetical protein [Clostridium aciditolerans]